MPTKRACGRIVARQPTSRPPRMPPIAWDDTIQPYARASPPSTVETKGANNAPITPSPIAEIAIKLNMTVSTRLRGTRPKPSRHCCATVVHADVLGLVDLDSVDWPAT